MDNMIDNEMDSMIDILLGKLIEIKKFNIEFSWNPEGDTRIPAQYEFNHSNAGDQWLARQPTAFSNGVIPGRGEPDAVGGWPCIARCGGGG